MIKMYAIFLVMMSFNISCSDDLSSIVVRGSSMSPCFPNETRVKYKPHNPKIILKKSDFVIFKRAKKLILKRVVATKGDTYSLVYNSKSSCFNLVVNKEVVKNLQGNEYCTERKTLKIFSDSNNSILPARNLIVMGEVLAGSEDSTLFGPIEESAIVGIVKSKCHK